LQKVAIVSINTPGFEASKRLEREIRADYESVLFYKNGFGDGGVGFGTLDDVMDEIWRFDVIVFFLATGIVVRKIAPRLISKTSDPAVLVCDFGLTGIVPLLSGHIGGANEFAEYICRKVDGCRAFISTATDQTSSFAFDMYGKKNGFEICNIKALAPVSNGMINGQKVVVSTYPALIEELKGLIKKQNVEYKNYDEPLNDSSPTVVISPYAPNGSPLWLRITDISIGLGMNRGTKKQEIDDTLKSFLAECALEWRQVGSICSFEAKGDEIGLLEFCDGVGIKPKFFKKEDINSLQNDFSPSRAADFFGIKGVAEPSAILGSKYKELFIKKRVYGGVTVAAAF